jgi:hypothetical protein
LCLNVAFPVPRQMGIFAEARTCCRHGVRFQPAGERLLKTPITAPKDSTVLKVETLRSGSQTLARVRVMFTIYTTFTIL